MFEDGGRFYRLVTTRGTGFLTSHMQIKLYDHTAFEYILHDRDGMMAVAEGELNTLDISKFS